MAFLITDMEDMLPQLTCTRCNKFLSVFPIYTSSAIGNVCGRCTQSIEQMISNNCVSRNTTYESLAEYALFPCSNQEFGCETNLKCDEVVDHERCCSHRQQTCPFNVNTTHGDVLRCDWKGGIANLNSHLNLTHTSRKTNSPHTFMLNIDKTNVEVNFATVDLHTFIITTRYDGKTNKIYSLVMCCTDATVVEDYAYQIELGKSHDFFLKLRKSNTGVLLDASAHLEKVDSAITVDVSAVKTLFGNFHHKLICRVSINKKLSKISESTPTPKETTHSDVAQKILQSNQQILEELECPVCNNYMKTPIYICPQGHSLCNECKTRIFQCPICRVPLVGSRNFTLEKLTQIVLGPCKYTRYGCTAVLNLHAVGQHETVCNFKTKCPLFMLFVQCNVKEEISNPTTHILENHALIVRKESVLYELHVERTFRSDYHVLINNNEIFIVCCKKSSINGGSLQFNFLHLGMKKTVPAYRYRLEFIDKNEMKLMVKQVCRPVPPCVSDVFQNCLTLPLDMLELNTKVVSFKMNIEQM